MPNNPIPPPPGSEPKAPDERKPVTEIPTVPNTFTAGINRPPLPKTPQVDEAVADTTGKHLSPEEQAKFLDSLPDELFAEFARRVQARIQTDVAPKVKKIEYVTDFTTLREQDIFNLNMPIQAIDHQVPEFLTIKLIDPNFAPRWIQTSSKRLGEARSQGWSYITEEDLAEKLKVEIEADASGHFVYIDTVAMKMPKKKLFTQLRSNYQRAIALTQQSKLHEMMKHTIESEIEGALDPESGLPLGDAWNKYNSEGKMTTYSPLG
jgi:hypothetical protein